MAVLEQTKSSATVGVIPATMRAAVYRGVNDVRLEIVPVPAVGKSEFDKGISGAGRLEHRFAAVAILNAGRVNPDGEEPTIGVGQDMALAALDLLARIVALRSPF